MKLTEEEIKMGVYDPNLGKPKKVSKIYTDMKRDFPNADIEKLFEL